MQKSVAESELDDFLGKLAEVVSIELENRKDGFDQVATAKSVSGKSLPLNRRGMLRALDRA